jgi:hypothetical protein
MREMLMCWRASIAQQIEKYSSQIVREWIACNKIGRGRGDRTKAFGSQVSTNDYIAASASFQLEPIGVSPIFEALTPQPKVQDSPPYRGQN